MKIAIAQTRAIKGDIDKNIANHERIIQRAISENADVIFFPELSITGYEPTLAKQLATHQGDSRFDSLQRISDTSTISICIGVPTVADDGICISMVIFQPGKECCTYSKQQIHSDEFPYFVNGRQQVLLTINNTMIAPAICYESLQPEHAENAVRAGAGMYVASAAKSANGVAKAFAHFPTIAKKYSMPVLMSNCVGPSDDFESMGSSAVWNKTGTLLAQLGNTHEGLLLFDTATDNTSAIML